MSKNNKSTSKNKKRDQQNIAKDMWQNLLNNPLPNPTSPNTQASGSSSQPTGFANLPPIANPFNLAPDDPRNNYQFQGWYQNTQWSPPQSQFPHHTQWSQPQPHFYQNTQWSPQHPHFSPSSSNPNHQQMNFTVPQTLEESSDEANPEPENEPEPESEAPNDRKKGKNVQKGRNAQKGKRVQIRWTEDEARILAERWIHCSENGVQGKNQSNESFWAKVINGYNSCVSQERNLNQLSGKWNKISHDSKTFQALYKHYKEICPQSGADENDVLNATRKAFRQQVGRAFIYESSWNVLKHYPKFFAEPGVMANEDSFQPFVTDLDADEFPTGTALDANMKRLFQDDYIRRPPGRKAAKSTASSSAGSSSRSVHSEKIDTLEAVRQTALAQQEAIKMIKENAIKKTAYKALSFLCKKLPKKASKKEIKMLKNARKEVVTLYQDKYGNNESDEDEQENANETDESSSD